MNSHCENGRCNRESDYKSRKISVIQQHRPTISSHGQVQIKAWLSAVMELKSIVRTTITQAQRRPETPAKIGKNSQILMGIGQPSSNHRLVTYGRCRPGVFCFKSPDDWDGR
jgi:hypothetical protein